MTNDLSQLTGYQENDKVEEWKKQNSKTGIYAVVSGEHVGYFRNPLRGDVNAALAAQDPERPLAVIEEFARLTFLGGSDAILGDDKVFFGVTAQLRTKMNGQTARLVNL